MVKTPTIHQIGSSCFCNNYDWDKKKIGITTRTNIKTIFQGAPCGDRRLLVELYPGSHGGTEHDYMIILYIFYYYVIVIL